MMCTGRRHALVVAVAPSTGAADFSSKHPEGLAAAHVQLRDVPQDSRAPLDASGFGLGS